MNTYVENKLKEKSTNGMLQKLSKTGLASFTLKLLYFRLLNKMYHQYAYIGTENNL